MGGAETNGLGVFVLRPGRVFGEKNGCSRNRFSVLSGGAVKHRSSFGVSPLGELTTSAERRSLSLALEPAATHAPTYRAEMVLAPLYGCLSYSAPITIVRYLPAVSS